MKTLIFYLVLVLMGGVVKAQEITELKETKVGFAPFSSEMTRSGNNFTFNVKENYVGEFQQDPVLFLENNLNVEKLLSEIEGKGIHSYNVTLTSSRGILQADFNAEGKLVKTSSRFKNILLPKELRHQLYRDHKGWAMVKNVHIARGSMGEINKEFYRVKLQNGKQRKNVTLEAPLRAIAVAGN